MDGILDKNVPVLVANVSVTWPCALAWSTQGGLESSLGGDTIVPVELDESSIGVYGGARRLEMPLREFFRGRRGYLKDYRLPRSLASDAYTIPAAFCEDALNQWLDSVGREGFRFLYAGWEGTRTPLHHDVLCSHSWSVNICGKKLWLLSEPGAGEDILYPRGRYNELSENSLLPSGFGCHYHAVSVSTPLSPSALQAFLSRPRGSLRVLLQGEGDAIFVPSGWHHEVFNVSKGLTLSVNHNWIRHCGGPCLRNAWLFLREEMAEIRKRLADIKQGCSSDEFSSACEKMLITDAGLGYKDFRDLLSHARADLQGRLAETTSLFSAASHMHSPTAHVKGSAVCHSHGTPYLEHCVMRERGRLSHGLQNVERILIEMDFGVNDFP